MIASFGIAGTVAAPTPPAIGPGDTGWMDASAFLPPYSVVVTGAGAGDTIEVRVANGFPPNPNAVPDPTYLGFLYATALAADGIVKVAEAYRYVRVRRLASTGILVIAYGAAWLGISR